MPRGDGTGPMGQGPMSGRAAGYCAGYDTPGFANPVGGRGRGMGFGRGRGAGGRGGGRGWRNMYYATGLPGWMRQGVAPMPEQGPTADVEKQALRNQVQALQSQLELVQKRLSELEPEAPQE